MPTTDEREKYVSSELARLYDYLRDGTTDEVLTATFIRLCDKTVKGE